MINKASKLDHILDVLVYMTSYWTNVMRNPSCLIPLYHSPGFYPFPSDWFIPPAYSTFCLPTHLSIPLISLYFVLILSPCSRLLMRWWTASSPWSMCCWCFCVSLRIAFLSSSSTCIFRFSSRSRSSTLLCAVTPWTVIALETLPLPFCPDSVWLWVSGAKSAYKKIHAS